MSPTDEEDKKIIDELSEAEERPTYYKRIPITNMPRLRRNAPCRCGSNKKYKVCCLPNS